MERRISAHDRKDEFLEIMEKLLKPYLLAADLEGDIGNENDTCGR